MRIRGVLLAAILAAACGRGSDDGEVRGSAPDSAGASKAVPDTADASAPVPVVADVVLAAEGLDVGGARLAFGGGREQVLAAVGGVLGAPQEQGTNEECPAGPLAHVQYAGLQLVFQDGSFVGWFAPEGSALRTAQGIGPGSTLGQLKAAYPAARVEETSLGTEFAANDLYGIVTNPSDEGKVQVVFAGTNCIFR